MSQSFWISDLKITEAMGKFLKKNIKIMHLIHRVDFVLIYEHLAFLCPFIHRLRTLLCILLREGGGLNTLSHHLYCMFLYFFPLFQGA